MPKPTIFKLVVAVVVILTAGGVGYAGLIIWRERVETGEEDIEVLTQNQAVEGESAAEAPVPEEVEPRESDWKTYRSEEYGFEVKYPPEWSISGTSDLDIAKQMQYQEQYDSDLFDAITLVQWIRGDALYPETIQIAGMSTPLDEYVLQRRNTDAGTTVSLRERTMNARTFTEITSLGSPPSGRGPSYSYSRAFCTDFPHPDFNTLCLRTFGWEDNRNELDAIAEAMSRFLMIQDPNEEEPFLLEFSDDVSSWETYRNEKYSFHIKYPAEVSEYIAEVESNYAFGGIILSIRTNDAYDSTEIFKIGGRRFDRPGLPAACSPQGGPTEVIGGLGFEKDEQNYLHRERPPHSKLLVNVTYRRQVDDVCFAFSYTRWGEKTSISVSEAEQRVELFERIVSTFRLGD